VHNDYYRVKHSEKRGFCQEKMKFCPRLVLGAFFCPRTGKKTGLSAPIPRQRLAALPAGFPLQSLARLVVTQQFSG
jgi:hypothetical protein